MSHDNHPPHWTPLHCASYDTVHGFRHGDKKGAHAMGPFVGKSPAVLSNEVNPDYQGAKFGLDDAVAAELAAKDYRILNAHAQMVRHVCFPLPDSSIPVGDIELLTKFSEWQAAMGNTCNEIHKALADGMVTRKEEQAIANAGHAHMARFMEFLSRLKEISE